MLKRPRDSRDEEGAAVKEVKKRSAGYALFFQKQSPILRAQVRDIFGRVTVMF